VKDVRTRRNAFKRIDAKATKRPIAAAYAKQWCKLLQTLGNVRWLNTCNAGNIIKSAAAKKNHG
jgi:hypothetical protein